MIRSFSAENDSLTVTLTVPNASEALRILALISSAVGVDVTTAAASGSPAVNIAMAASATPPQLAAGPKRQRTPTANVAEPASPASPASPAASPTQPIVLPPPPPPTQPAALAQPVAAVVPPTPPPSSTQVVPPSTQSTTVTAVVQSAPASVSVVDTDAGDIPVELTAATCTLREVLIHFMRKGIRTADALYAHCLAMEAQVPCISRLKANLQERIERMVLLVTEADLAPK